MLIPNSLRKVHTLRLRAPDAQAVRSGAILFEDALRTCSIPGGEGGRLLLVREIHLGRISRFDSPATLALQIERQMWDLSGRAVYAEDPSAPSQPVVYFHDAADALIQLTQRVARGQSTDAWFWRAAVPQWEPQLSRERALRVLLSAALEIEPVVLTLARLVRELARVDALDALLAVMRESDGPALLQACEWTRVEAETKPTRAVTIPPAWDATLARWVQVWGMQDARTLWLAATILVLANPARVGDSKLAARAEQVVRAFRATDETARAVRARDSDFSTAATLNPRTEMPKATSLKDARLETNKAAIARENAVSLPKIWRAHASSDVSPLSSDAPASTERIADSPTREHVATAANAVTARGWQPTQYAGFYFLLSALERLGIAAFLEADTELVECGFAARLLEDLATRLNIPREDAVRSALETPQYEWTRETFVAPKHWFRGLNKPNLQCSTKTSGWKTRIAANLNEYPPMTESSERFAEIRLDSRKFALEEFPSLNIPPACDVALEMTSRPKFQGVDTFKLRRIRGTDHGYVLCDASERLTLACWRGNSPEEIRDVVEHSAVGRDFAPESVFDLLLRAWRVALTRWCWMYAGLRVRTIVARPGQIYVTPTHLEVELDHHLADVRIRQAGLDLDPGWTPWFGRVVLFHYRYGGRSED